MKKEAIFMMIFRFTPDFTYQPTAQEQAEMKEQWGTFIGNIAISEKLVSTYQLGFEGTQIKADRSKEHDILLTEGQTLGGNMIVKANFA